jgi:hypothetical protein
VQRKGKREKEQEREEAGREREVENNISRF